MRSLSWRLIEGRLSIRQSDTYARRYRLTCTTKPCRGRHSKRIMAMLCRRRLCQIYIIRCYSFKLTHHWLDKASNLVKGKSLSSEDLWFRFFLNSNLKPPDHKSRKLCQAKVQRMFKNTKTSLASCKWETKKAKLRLRVFNLKSKHFNRNLINTRRSSRSTRACHWDMMSSSILWRMRLKGHSSIFSHSRRFLSRKKAHRLRRWSAWSPSQQSLRNLICNKTCSTLSTTSMKP